MNVNDSRVIAVADHIRSALGASTGLDDAVVFQSMRDGSGIVTLGGERIAEMHEPGMIQAVKQRVGDDEVRLLAQFGDRGTNRATDAIAQLVAAQNSFYPGLVTSNVAIGQSAEIAMRTPGFVIRTLVRQPKHDFAVTDDLRTQVHDAVAQVLAGAHFVQ
jgi:hypothetical protein